jgi:hypothetical protein
VQHDLARLQGELERERNHMSGLLRDAEWKLDKRAQVILEEPSKSLKTPL